MLETAKTGRMETRQGSDGANKRLKGRYSKFSRKTQTFRKHKKEGKGRKDEC